MAHEYTKNLWTNGDVITASKLNLIDDELEELNNDIAAVEQSVGQFAAYTDMSVLNVESSKYIASGSNAGALTSTSENVNTYIYDVDGVQFVKIKVIASSSTYGRYAFYSSSSTFAKSTCLQSGAASSNYQILQVPNGAYGLAVCGTTVDVKEISSSDEIYAKQESQLLNFAEPYDPTKVYELNEYCTYGDHFYRRTTETTAAEASWVSNNWTQVSLVDALEETKEEVNDIVENLEEMVDRNNANLAEEYDSTQTYDIGNYVLHNNSIWRCSTAITTPETWTPQHWSLTFIGRELQIIISGEEPNTWTDVQYAVRKGYGSQLYPVGTQFTVHHDTYGDMIFDVVSHNYHKNPNNINAPTMTLEMHNCISNLPFDGQEAIFYVDPSQYPNGLEPATYSLKMPPNYSGNLNTNNWQYVTFTLTQLVPAGGALSFNGWNSGTIDGHQLYSFTNLSNNTAIESKIALTNTGEGTLLGTILYNNDAATTTINHLSRARIGSNNWRESNLRQWLNTNNTAGNWWTPQTNFDRLEVIFRDINSFQYGMDESFLQVIQPVNIITCANFAFEINSNDKTNGYYTTTDKFFILSLSELDLEVNDYDRPFDYYNNANATVRIKYDITDNITAKTLRFRGLLSSDNARNTNATQTTTLNKSTGKRGNNVNVNTGSGYGIVAACVIY